MGLTTNFSGGELSANLFGRIDLPQYHSGAAHLENWDVIPTGGIKRRSGMERLKQLEAEGRIIPAIISLDEIYLLLFTDQNIAVYGKREVEGKLKWDWDNPLKNFTNGDVSPETLYTTEEIPEIQYAQNQRMFVITHQNHQPLQIGFYPNDIYISVFKINFAVQQFKDGVDISESVEDEDDSNYKDKKWLQQNGEWPGTVTFFCGRLIFAGTINSPQLVMASKVNDYNNFSTYKKFIKEEKELFSIQGTILGDSNVITVKDTGSLSFFDEDISKYVVESQYFKPNTVLLEPPNTSNDKIKVSSYCNLQPPLNDTEISELDQWKYDAAHTTTSWTTIGNDNSTANRPFMLESSVTSVKIIVQRTEYVAVLYDEHPEGRPKDIPISLAQEITYLSETIVIQHLRDFIKEFADSIAIKYEKYPSVRPMHFTPSTFSASSGFDIAINDLYNQIKTFWQKTYRGKYFFGTPNEIYQQIMIYFNAGIDVFIPFYRIKQSDDKYPTPDCGFTFEIASGRNDAIKWLCVNRGIIVGTETGEYLIPPDVHATNTRAIALSRHGSDSIQGVALGDATLFFKSGRKGLVEYYPNENDHFRANDMALLAEQMLRESPAKEFDYAANPYTKLYITRENGTLVTLLYERVTGTFAWGRITTGEVTRDVITPEEIERAREAKERRRGDSPWSYDFTPFEPPKKLKRFVEGEIISCSVLPGEDGFDDAYLVVKRKNNFFLERLKEEGTVYLDSWREWKWETGEEKQSLIAAYDAETAVVYDEAKIEVYGLKGPEAGLPAPSEEGNRRYIGYPYTSAVKSMPVVEDEKMQPVNVTRLYVRLSDSYKPVIWSGENVKSDLRKKDVYNCVCKEANEFSGQSSTLQFDITHDAPNRCRVLSVYTEV